MDGTGALYLLMAVTTVTAALPGEDITLTVPQTFRRSLHFYQNYTISVNTSSTPANTYSSFSLQVHSQLFHVFLTSGSFSCNGTYDEGCTASGSNVGLVQVWNEGVTVVLFHTRVECDPGECTTNSTVPVLFAVVGVPVEAPIPGGCALTSDLLIDPNLAVSYTSISTEVQFQDSDVGFRPSSQPYPVCDRVVNSTHYPLQDLEYTVHQKCLGSQQFSVSAMMDAIQDMLSVALTEKQESSYSTLKYTDPKRITFASIPGQGVVYNVIATDTRTGVKTVYVPTITYACDIHSQDTQSCRGDVPVINAVIGGVLLLLGLALCLLGHIFFHGEVVIFHCVGGWFLWFMILSITTSLSLDLLTGLSLLCGAVYCLVWFLFWFLTGWHWFHVIVFGLYADFLITASLLYSPIDSVVTVLQISYVYYLVVICGMILFMVPVVAFPRALSVWSSSLVGSYTCVFGVGMFTYTELSEIVLLVVRKFSIPGFYSAHIDCPLMTTDYIMIAVWLFLLVVGLTVQTTVVQRRRTKHNRRQQSIANNSSQARFNSFPHPSLLKRLLRYRKRHCPESEPLLSPGHLNSPRHTQWSHGNSTRLPNDGHWSPGNSGVYPSNYGATVNERVYQ